MSNFNCKIGKVTFKADSKLRVLHPNRADMNHFLETQKPTSDLKVLQKAIDDALQDVVVVGYDRKGEFTVRGAHPDRFHTIGLLERGVKYVMPW